MRSAGIAVVLIVVLAMGIGIGVFVSNPSLQKQLGGSFTSPASSSAISTVASTLGVTSQTGISHQGGSSSSAQSSASSASAQATGISNASVLGEVFVGEAGTLGVWITNLGAPTNASITGQGTDMTFQKEVVLVPTGEAPYSLNFLINHEIPTGTTNVQLAVAFGPLANPSFARTVPVSVLNPFNVTSVVVKGVDGKCVSTTSSDAIGDEFAAANCGILGSVGSFGEVQFVVHNVSNATSCFTAYGTEGQNYIQSNTTSLFYAGFATGYLPGATSSYNGFERSFQDQCVSSAYQSFAISGNGNLQLTFPVKGNGTQYTIPFVFNSAIYQPLSAYGSNGVEVVGPATLGGLPLVTQASSNTYSCVPTYGNPNVPFSGLQVMGYDVGPEGDAKLANITITTYQAVGQGSNMTWQVHSVQTYTGFSCEVTWGSPTAARNSSFGPYDVLDITIQGTPYVDNGVFVPVLALNFSNGESLFIGGAGSAAG